MHESALGGSLAQLCQHLESGKIIKAEGVSRPSPNGQVHHHSTLLQISPTVPSWNPGPPSWRISDPSPTWTLGTNRHSANISPSWTSAHTPLPTWQSTIRPSWTPATTEHSWHPVSIKSSHFLLLIPTIEALGRGHGRDQVRLEAHMKRRWTS